MKIVKKTTIGNLTSKSLVNIVIEVCEDLYEAVKGSGDEARLTALKDEVKARLKTMLTDESVSGLEATLHWEECVAPIWAVVAAGFTATDELNGR